MKSVPGAPEPANVNSAAKPASRDGFRSRPRILVIVSLCVLLLSNVVYRFLVGHQTEPSPPDLTHCTRIEVHYRISVADYLAPFGDDPNLATSEEITHLRSLKQIVIEDRRIIKTMASAIGRGSYVEGHGRVSMRPNFEIVSYRGEQQTASIPVYASDLIVTGQGYTFSYDKELPEPVTLVPETRDLALRARCAYNMTNLYSDLEWYARQEGTYPTAQRWCDVILHAAEIDGVANETMKSFKCPGARRGRCQYAMNPGCKPDSAPDVVLLFETKAGWNQHGGLELFAFDNHDPKGGLVLLNDGTVKFIRTEEELKQLRWK